MIHISILSLRNCLHSAVTGMGELFLLANSLYGTRMFHCDVLSGSGDSVVSFSGTSIHIDKGIAEANPDIVIIPPMMGDLEHVLSDQKLLNWLTNHCASGRLVGTVCAGSFLLAETGLIDGRDATTHWNLADRFASRYPSVNLQIERLLVDGGDYICAGGVSAWMDLALHLISRHAGRGVALDCAKMMLMEPHREYQTPYGRAGFRKNHGDEAVLKAQQWVEDNFVTGKVADMADMACLSPRTFLRRFRAATGLSPMEYLQHLRIDAAKSLLESTDTSIDSIAEEIGYGDYSAFRKLFNKTMGMSPSAYRKRFSLKS